MNCYSCGIEIEQEKDGYDLCDACYKKAVENQCTLWKELAEWTRDEKLHVLKVTMTGGKL